MCPMLHFVEFPSAVPFIFSPRSFWVSWVRLPCAIITQVGHLLYRVALDSPRPRTFHDANMLLQPYCLAKVSWRSTSGWQ